MAEPSSSTNPTDEVGSGTYVGDSSGTCSICGKIKRIRSGEIKETDDHEYCVCVLDEASSSKSPTNEVGSETYVGDSSGICSTCRKMKRIRSGEIKKTDDHEYCVCHPRRYELERHILKFLLPHFYYPPSSDPLEICFVCLTKYRIGEVLGGILCKHRFHYECIQQWLLELHGCPQCNCFITSASTNVST